ncbi:MAG: restriction endonuclease subunit S [Nostoc sp.]
MQLTVDSGQLPVGWEIKYLDKLCENLDSKRVPITKSSRKSGNIPYYGASGIVDYVDDYIFDEDLLLVSEDGANLLARSYPIAFSITGKTWVNNHAHVLHFEEKITQSFIEYYLNSISLKPYVSGMAQPKLSQKSLNSIPIPFPPLSKQKRIVAILDEAFEGIDRAITNTEKNFTNARELFESYLNAIFIQKGDGWEEKTLKQVSIQFGRGKSRHRPRNDQKLYSGKYPFIQTGDIRNSNHIVTSYLQTYNEVGLAQSKLWPKGTVCITIAANIAETGVLDFEACIPDSVIGLVVDLNKANNMFVEYMLQAFKLFLKAKGKGSAQDNINMGTFEAQTFPFPSIDEQEIIVARLDFISTETQRLEAIYKLKITALNELKQSILQKAFTGELTADTANQTTKAAQEVNAA